MSPLNMKEDEWKGIHTDMGCYDCKFADGEMLGKGPCCTYPGQIEVFPFGDDAGKCKIRRSIMPKLHETQYGKILYESHIPRIVTALEKIAEEMEKVNGTLQAILQSEPRKAGD